MRSFRYLILALLCAVAQGVLATDYNVGTDSELRAAIANDGANITITADIDLSNSTHESVTFTKVTPDAQASQPNNGSLQIALTQANTRSNAMIDNAIVSFNEGNELEKFYFGIQNANIHLPQDGKDYAIAYSERQGELPLNFKATENGTYTLTISETPNSKLQTSTTST